MFGLILSALNTMLAWVFRSILVKFALYFGLYFVTTEFVAVVQTWLPDGRNVATMFGTLPSEVWYFLTLCAIPQGIPMVLSAYVTRFAIRRIPVIG